MGTRAREMSSGYQRQGPDGTVVFPTAGGPEGGTLRLLEVRAQGVYPGPESKLPSTKKAEEGRKQTLKE